MMAMAEALHRLVQQKQQPGKRHSDDRHVLLFSDLSRVSGERVVEIVVFGPVEGMAAGDAFQGEPRTLCGAIFVLGLQGILRAGGHKQAAGDGKRGDTALAVKAHQAHQQ
jgi:hypothetical protein